MSVPNIPFASWRLRQFIAASPEELKRKVVDCTTCPVARQCKAGEGGTGWTCPTCRATGVWIDKPEREGKLPKDVFGVDCGAHNFHTRRETFPVPPGCPFCSGALAEIEAWTSVPIAQHMIMTRYAHVPVEERQKFLKEQFAFWTRYYTRRSK